MAFLDNWDPFNLPRGSVRAIVTLALLSALWTLVAKGREIPMALGMACLVTTGHYFGSRTRSRRKGPHPLFLPRGSVRFLIVTGFAIVGFVLWNQGRFDFFGFDRTTALYSTEGALIGGFTFKSLFDKVMGGKVARLQKWIENAKATLATVAAGGLGIASLLTPDGSEPSNLTLLAAPFIVFYFGSRR